MIKEEKKFNYKEGDKVRVIDGSIIPSDALNWMKRMNKLVGKTVTLEAVDNNDNTVQLKYEETDDGIIPSFWMDMKWIEPIEEEHMTEYKFKIGDRVRVLDGSDSEGYTGGFTCAMKPFIGTELTVESAYSYMGKNAYKLSEKTGYTWDERGLELVEKNKATPNAIESGDVIKALAKVCATDEDIRELIIEMPEMLLLLGMVAGKIEKELFGEEE